MVTGFARQTSLDAINEQIKEEEKILRKLSKEKENLIKDQETYESGIKEAEELISKRIKQLEQNASYQEKGCRTSFSKLQIRGGKSKAKKLLVPQ